MNKSKVIAIFAVGMLVSNLLLVGFIFTHHPHPPRDFGPKNEIIHRLDFSPEQVTAYEKLIHWHRTEIDKADRHIMDLKNALYQTFDNPDTKAKDSLMTEIAKQQMAIESIHYKHFQDIEKLCTTAQRPKFQELTHDLAAYFHPGPKRHHP